MKLFLFLCAISIAITVALGEYDHVVLKRNVHSPYQLAIDYKTNTLFFSYSTNTDEVLKSAYLNLETKEFGAITGINKGFANAVDNVKHVVYLGGREGIFKYNSETKGAVNLGITDKSIWQMFYKDGLYFTTYPEEEAYLYSNGVVNRVPELSTFKTMLVALDNDRNIYYSNSSGIFCYEKNTKTTTHLGEHIVNGFTSDNNNKIYFSTPGGIYYINHKTKQIVEIISNKDNNIHGVAIENDGTVIYGAENSIVRLKKKSI